MSFQDLGAGGGGSGGGGKCSSSSAARASSSNSSQAVAAGRQNTRHKIVQLVKEVSAKLKSLSASDHDTHVDASKRIEDAKLARDFQTTLQEFQKVQQLASERESTYSPSAPPSSLVTTSSSDDQLACDMNQEKQPFLLEQKRQEVLLLGNEIAFNEAIIEEREHGIRDIQDEIEQANENFKDLAVLVHEQGVVIDAVHSTLRLPLLQQPKLEYSFLRLPRKRNPNAHG
ncbi:hypothetical protein RJ639_012798 [Escallonia herrerae]|uniref:t-SNARE coiled-coil homology domain-containing protein n=1 Tax=Escallonia herrerae TaxID=1293975 RepID=A0AA88VNG3_9ASTE|nr:hypothetical protein RJ639_012798 [Escallonia herrerae]